MHKIVKELRQQLATKDAELQAAHQNNQAAIDQSPDHALKHVQQELDQLKADNRAFQRQNKALEANLAQIKSEMKDQQTRHETHMQEIQQLHSQQVLEFQTGAEKIKQSLLQEMQLASSVRSTHCKILEERRWPLLFGYF